MARNIHPVTFGEADITEDEHVVLVELLGERPEIFHDYGVGDLLSALRRGYELGRRDALDEERGV